MGKGRVIYLRDVTRTSGWQLVDVDEEAFVRIARVEGQHAVVDVLLETGTLVAGGQRAARSAGEEAGLDALRLRVVGHVLHDDTPLSFDVLGAHRSGVQHFRRTDVAFGADPVGFFERAARVAGIMELALLGGGHSVDQIVGRLVSYVGVFLQHQRVVIDSVLLNG